jgi:thiosulfate dehydrogenase [quinone] large subunit
MKINTGVLVALRLMMAVIMLWAFADKVFGLGFSTSSDKSWLSGVSPTEGFLKFGVDGLFASFFKMLAGSVWVDWLFMIGLLGVGTGMLLGIAMRISGYSGATMMFLLWLASVPPEHNPILDEHSVYMLVFLGLAHSSAGEVWGMGWWWKNLTWVRKVPIWR